MSSSLFLSLNRRVHLSSGRCNPLISRRRLWNTGRATTTHGSHPAKTKNNNGHNKRVLFLVSQQFDHSSTSTIKRSTVDYFSPGTDEQTFDKKKEHLNLPRPHCYMIGDPYPTPFEMSIQPQQQRLKQRDQIINGKYVLTGSIMDFDATGTKATSTLSTSRNPMQSQPREPSLFLPIQSGSTIGMLKRSHWIVRRCQHATQSSSSFSFFSSFPAPLISPPNQSSPNSHTFIRKDLIPKLKVSELRRLLLQQKYSTKKDLVGLKKADLIQLYLDFQTRAIALGAQIPYSMKEQNDACKQRRRRRRKRSLDTITTAESDPSSTSNVVDETTTYRKLAPVSNTRIQAHLETDTQYLIPTTAETTTSPKDYEKSNRITKNLSLNTILTQHPHFDCLILRCRAVGDLSRNSFGIGMVLLASSSMSPDPATEIWHGRQYVRANTSGRDKEYRDDYAKKHQQPLRSAGSSLEVQYNALSWALQAIYDSIIAPAKQQRQQKDLPLRFILQSDSDVVIHQVQGKYEIHNPQVRPAYWKTIMLMESYFPQKFTAELINNNKQAVTLARLACVTRKSINLHLLEQPRQQSEQLLQGEATPQDNTMDDVNRHDKGSNLIDPTKRYLLRFDGGSRGFPNTAAGIGMVLYDCGDMTEIWCGWKYLENEDDPSPFSNNETEYIALVIGLQCASSIGIRNLDVEGDSELVVKQIRGVYVCRQSYLQEWKQQAKKMLKRFQDYTLSYIPREMNSRADELANVAMDTGESWGFDEITDRQ